MRTALVAAAAAIAMAVGATATDARATGGKLGGPTSLVLPPIVQAPTGKHLRGKVVWRDLVTSNLAQAKRFYAGLFGWTFDDVLRGRPSYSIALLDGVPVAGLVQPRRRAGRHRHPAWLTFISVPNAGQAERDALAHGGKDRSPPRTYPRRGRQAVLVDPQGAVFAVLTSESGDPDDDLAAPGDWIWSALITRDPNTDAAFYQAVFGYEVFERPSDASLDHLVLSSGGYARASINAFPGSASKANPHWIDFVRVMSATQAAARAAALGGRVLVKPHGTADGSSIAVLADPEGAPFGVLEWPGGTARGPK